MKRFTWAFYCKDIHSIYNNFPENWTDLDDDSVCQVWKCYHKTLTYHGDEEKDAGVTSADWGEALYYEFASGSGYSYYISAPRSGDVCYHFYK